MDQLLSVFCPFCDTKLHNWQQNVKCNKILYVLVNKIPPEIEMFPKYRLCASVLLQFRFCHGNDTVGSICISFTSYMPKFLNTLCTKTRRGSPEVLVCLIVGGRRKKLHQKAKFTYLLTTTLHDQIFWSNLVYS